MNVMEINNDLIDIKNEIVENEELYESGGEEGMNKLLTSRERQKAIELNILDKTSGEEEGGMADTKLTSRSIGNIIRHRRSSGRGDEEEIGTLFEGIEAEGLIVAAEDIRRLKETLNFKEETFAYTGLYEEELNTSNDELIKNGSPLLTDSNNEIKLSISKKRRALSPKEIDKLSSVKFISVDQNQQSAECENLLQINLNVLPEHSLFGDTIIPSCALLEESSSSNSSLQPEGDENLNGLDKPCAHHVGPKTLLNSNSSPIFCDFCGKSFKHKRSLRKHLLCHSTSKPFSCEICEKSFKRKDKLKDHMLCHTEIKPYTCDMCEKTFKRNRELKQHFLFHSNVKMFVCDVCKKSFKIKRALNEHMLCHTNSKPYNCQVCDKTYARKDHLKDHMLTHSDARPFICDVCEKTFIRKDHLKLHMVCHSDYKPFVCETCRKTFRRKSNLREHVITHL